MIVVAFLSNVMDNGLMLAELKLSFSRNHGFDKYVSKCVNERRFHSNPRRGYSNSAKNPLASTAVQSVASPLGPFPTAASARCCNPP